MHYSNKITEVFCYVLSTTLNFNNRGCINITGHATTLINLNPGHFRPNYQQTYIIKFYLIYSKINYITILILYIFLSFLILYYGLSLYRVAPIKHNYNYCIKDSFAYYYNVLEYRLLWRGIHLSVYENYLGIIIIILTTANDPYESIVHSVNSPRGVRLLSYRYNIL